MTEWDTLANRLRMETYLATAQQLGVTETDARARLDKLQGEGWKGQPVNLVIEEALRRLTSEVENQPDPAPPNMAYEFFDWPEEDDMALPAKMRWRRFRSLLQRDKRA